MKRYMLFHGTNFYPVGGMEDFKKDSDDIADLMPFIDEIEYCEWAHIYDTHKRKIIMIAEAVEGNGYDDFFKWSMLDE